MPNRNVLIHLVKVMPNQIAWSAVGDDLLQELHARVYVADLPPKYNLHIIANEGCEEGHILKEMLANPLGPLFEGSLDKALYRFGLALAANQSGLTVLR